MCLCLSCIMSTCQGELCVTPCCRCYVTPRSFLDLLAQYGHLLRASRTELGDKRRRLLDGIAKLAETNNTLDAMRNQLNDLQPLLAEKTAATSTLLQQVSPFSAIASVCWVHYKSSQQDTRRFHQYLAELPCLCRHMIQCHRCCVACSNN